MRTSQSGLVYPLPQHRVADRKVSFNPDSSLDPTFGTDGKVRIDFFGQEERVDDITIQADGRIVAAGGVDTDTGSGSQSDFALARYQNSAAIRYDICLQDDATGDILKFNSTTGDYLFIKCDAPGFTLSGRGAIIKLGCLVSLTDLTFEYTVTATVNTCTEDGRAVVVLPLAGRNFRINDRDISNNSGTCR